MKSMIVVNNVIKKYGDVIAIDEISFEVASGDVCIILGPSGCGKSTTLRVINRLIEPTSGNVLIDGQSIERLNPEQLRRHIGYAIQSVGLFPHMTVAQNIAVVPRLLSWPKERVDKRTDELLDIIGLTLKYKTKYPKELSGGEAQRIGVARALAADPPILLMDEPFGAVDPLTRERLQIQFKRIQSELKKTVVFVTHDVDEAVRLADKIVLMKEGKIVQHDTPEKILAQPASRFVKDFIGTDRALKRLSRFSVSDNMRRPGVVVVGQDADRTIEKAKLEELKFLWAVDNENKLLGWIDIATYSGPWTDKMMTTIKPAEISVFKDSSLKETLSRMLGQGIETVPVVDKDFKIIGEISLSDIEKVTKEGDFK